MAGDTPAGSVADTSAVERESGGLTQFAAIADRFPAYLRGQRGLSENTVRIYLDDLRSFREYLRYRNWA